MVPAKKKDDIITAAEKYIQENGTGAFREIINKAEHTGPVRREVNGVFVNEYQY